MSKVGAIFLFENTWKGVPFVHFPFSFSKNAAASWMLLQEVCTKHDLQSGSNAAPKRKHYHWEIYTLSGFLSLLTCGMIPHSVLLVLYSVQYFLSSIETVFEACALSLCKFPNAAANPVEMPPLAVDLCNVKLELVPASVRSCFRVFSSPPAWLLHFLCRLYSELGRDAFSFCQEKLFLLARLDLYLVVAGSIFKGQVFAAMLSRVS